MQKVWKDNKDQDGIRPESVKVKLYAEATGLTRDTFADTLLLQPISPIGSPTISFFSAILHQYRFLIPNLFIQLKANASIVGISTYPMELFL